MSVFFVDYISRENATKAKIAIITTMNRAGSQQTADAKAETLVRFLIQGHQTLALLCLPEHQIAHLKRPQKLKVAFLAKMQAPDMWAGKV